jgi:hypothetical protein
MPPPVVLLWLITYCIFPIIASLALGPSTFRRQVVATRRKLWGPIRDEVAVAISTTVSTLIQIAATVSSGLILRADDPSVSLRSMVLLWFSRPLATPIIQWLTMINIPEYSENSWEIARVDAIYGLVSVALFGMAAKITNQKHPGDVPRPARLARAGSALGILHFIFTVPVIIGIYLVPQKIRAPHIIFSFCQSSLRFTACWLLVAGLFSTNPNAFCPDTKTMKRIVVLWLFVAFVDQFWRMLAACDINDSGNDDQDGDDC